MELKFVLIFCVLLVALTLLVYWNNKSLKKLLKKLDEGQNQLPDEKYFELKYKIQYLSFVAAFVLVNLGMLGYSSLVDIKVDVLRNLNTEFKAHQGMIDSLIVARIDTTTKLLSYSHSVYKESMGSSIATIKSSQDLMDRTQGTLNKYIEYVKKWGRMHVINDYKLTDLNKPIKIISFEELGIKDNKSIPVLFVSPKSNFNVTLNNITLKNFELEIKNARSDTVFVGIVLFEK